MKTLKKKFFVKYCRSFAFGINQKNGPSQLVSAGPTQSVQNK